MTPFVDSASGESSWASFGLVASRVGTVRESFWTLDLFWTSFALALESFSSQVLGCVSMLLYVCIFFLLEFWSSCGVGHIRFLQMLHA